MNKTINKIPEPKFNNIQLYPNYQPIVSITKGRITGFEGLIRGTAMDSIPVTPKELFEQAHKTDTTLELDRLCRNIILNNFAASS